jgi:hypothetical protein
MPLPCSGQESWALATGSTGTDTPTSEARRHTPLHPGPGVGQIITDAEEVFDPSAPNRATGSVNHALPFLVWEIDQVLRIVLLVPVEPARAERPGVSRNPATSMEPSGRTRTSTLLATISGR